MLPLEKLVRPNILSLKPYSSARDEFMGNEGIFLDANENPFGYLNRYPDPHQTLLKATLSALRHIPVTSIFIGNGSDEVIDLLFRIFCNPSKDKVIICPPTYGMYEVSANIHDVAIIHVPLINEFQIDCEAISLIGRDHDEVKMIFLCSPNNPTGNNLNDIEEVLKTFDGIVVVDEAYIDFSYAPSFINTLHKHPNLVVMQTFSKAWGLAAARVGLAFASEEIISLMNKVKPPYNVSALNQQAALAALYDIESFDTGKSRIIAQRDRLEEALKTLPCVHRVYPSAANFLLVEVIDADAVYKQLVTKNVITRNRTTVVKNCIRITIGSADENQRLIEELQCI